MKQLVYATVLFSLGIIGNAQAAFIHDNGDYSGTQVGRFNSGGWTMFEDFSLSSSTTLTGLSWRQHDQRISYSSTDLAIFSSLPDGGSPLFSLNTVANRIANSTGILFGSYSGFDYSITSLSVTLGAGTYYISLHNNVSGGLTTWDETDGTGQTIPGRWQSTNPLSASSFYASEDSVFQISGERGGNTIPEPSGLALIAIGLAALGLFRRKKVTA